MVVGFPDDPACTHLERQYLLGDDLLVAPVFSAESEVAYYVPKDTWTHVLTGETVHAPARRSRSARRLIARTTTTPII